MDKVKLAFPVKTGCSKYHEEDGFQKNCPHCEQINKERRTLFIEKIRQECYKNISANWSSYLSRIENSSSYKDAVRKIIIEKAIDMMIDLECPYSNKSGIRIYKEILLEYARLNEDSFVPVIKVKDNVTGKNKTVILW